MTHRPFLLATAITLLLLLAACRAKAPVPQAATATLTAPPPPTQSGPAATRQTSPTPPPDAPPTVVPPPAESSATPAPPTDAPTEAPAAASPTPDAPTPAPSETGGPVEAACKNQAAFVDDITIPDDSSLRQSDHFIKTWRVRNAGECAWDDRYDLVFSGGEMFNAPLTSPLPAAAPGETVDISLQMSAPNRGGSYISNWEFQNPAGERFGVGFSNAGPLWVKISVSFFVATAQPPANGAASPPVPTIAACPATRETAIESSILVFINQARQENGLSPLALQDQLSNAAALHSIDMSCNENVSHTGSDGSTWYDRVSAQGYANYNSARENIYVGNPAFGGDARGAFDWWWNSQIHQENMLNPDVSQIGIAYVYNPQSEYGGYFTTVFARP